MALIVLPSLAGPLTAAIVDAIRKPFVQQLGGVFAGLGYPGNLDASNFGWPQFRLSQKLEPRSHISFTLRPQLAAQGTAGCTLGPLPFDLEIASLTFVYMGYTGDTFPGVSGTLTPNIGGLDMPALRLPDPDGVPLANGKLPFNTPYAWSVDYHVPAGTLFRVKSSLVLGAGTHYHSDSFVLVGGRALHVR